MPDKKLTDNEIVKALECCKNGTLNDCDGCPCFCDEDINTARECAENLMSNALDLINRLQAQIDEMFDTLDYRAKKILELEDNLKTAKAENSNLEVKISEVEYDFSLLKQEREVVKAEAYKEFAEKIEERIAVKILKDKSNEYAEGFVDALDGVNGEIDNLLKELVGEDK